jgi:hypothetical protein
VNSNPGCHNLRPMIETIMPAGTSTTTALKSHKRPRAPTTLRERTRNQHTCEDRVPIVGFRHAQVLRARRTREFPTPRVAP